jgi:F0F1-type ATP synthase assembly protein I
MNDLGKTSAYIALFSEIGFVLLIAVLAGVLAGYWIDQRLGTVPVFVLVGFAAGTIGGAVACWRLIARFLARLDESDRDGKE